MKILYIITKSELGGAQSHLLDVASFFFQKHNEVRVITGEQGWLTEKLEAQKVPVEILPDLENTYNPFKLVALIIKLRKSLKRLSPEIVHSHSSIAGLIARFSVIGTKIISVFTMHGCPFSDAYSFKHRALSILSEYILSLITKSYVIYVSNYDRALSHRWNVAPKDSQLEKVIYNGIDNLEVNAREEVRLPIKVVMVARFAHPKDHETVIQAARILRDEPFVFYFIGDGPLLLRCQELVRKLQLTGKVKFLGAIPDAKYKLKDYDVFLLSSKAEGLPISILEAMSSGLPVIASSVGGIPELIKEGFNGFLFDRGSHQMLAESLLKLKSTELRQNIGNASKTFFLKSFTKKQMFESLEHLYLQARGSLKK